jgi:hypothetical protein
MTGLPVGKVDDSNPFTLIQELSEIGGNAGFVVRVGDDEENVCFESSVRLRRGERIFLLSER